MSSNKTFRPWRFAGGLHSFDKMHSSVWRTSKRAFFKRLTWTEACACIDATIEGRSNHGRYARVSFSIRERIRQWPRLVVLVAVLVFNVDFTIWCVRLKNASRAAEQALVTTSYIVSEEAKMASIPQDLLQPFVFLSKMGKWPCCRHGKVLKKS